MGLDMYLNKAKRINNATAREIGVAGDYLDWLLRPSKYKHSTMYKWCGVNISEVNMTVVDEYRYEYQTRYYAWDDEHKYGHLGLFDGVGYWRKANAIHKWFVENVQNGEDDCGTYEVTKDQLEELLSVCKKVKNSPRRAEELLPAQSGFFFGSTEYDEWYMDNIDLTIDIMTKVLKETDFEKEVVTYSSSW